KRGWYSALRLADEGQDKLEGAGGPLRMPDLTLRTAHKWRGVASSELALDDRPFHLIVVACAGRVCADEVDAGRNPARVFERAADRTCHARTCGIGSRLVKTVGGKSVAADTAPIPLAAASGVHGALEDQEARSFAKRGALGFAKGR